MSGELGMPYAEHLDKPSDKFITVPSFVVKGCNWLGALTMKHQK